MTLRLHRAIIEHLRQHQPELGEYVEKLVVDALVRELATRLPSPGGTPSPHAEDLVRCLEQVGSGYVQTAIQLKEREEARQREEDRAQRGWRGR